MRRALFGLLCLWLFGCSAEEPPATKSQPVATATQGSTNAPGQPANTTAAQAPAKPTGKFTASYSKPKRKKHKDIYEALKEAQLLEDFAAGLNEYLYLPRDIKLVAAECGEANAFYSPDDTAITLCYEFVSDLVKQADSDELDEEEQESFIAGTLLFVLLHEVGHALTHVLDLPVTGKEEDAVDQLAAVLLIDDSGSDAEFDENVDFLAQAATWFVSMEAGEYDSEAYADEHSLGEQRYYNMMCWIYGARPEEAQDIIEDELLPESRAQRCPEEYRQISSAWQRLLKPHLR